jgi:predicted nucleic acid-binding protein
VILVDANIFITYLRTNDAKLLAILRTHAGATCRVVRAEVLHGVQTPSQRADAMTVFAPLAHVPMPDALWDQIGDNLSLLRRRGITVPFNDGVIVTLAIAADLEVWTRDTHFPLIQTALPALRLFVEPP